MKAATYAAASAALATGVAASQCHADNCLRALRATQTPGRLEAAQTFCASFTASPPAATPPAVPSYAVAACVSNQVGPMSVRLSSACECIAPNTTTTVPPPTSSVPVPTAACALASSAWAAQVSASPQGRPPRPQDWKLFYSSANRA